MYTTFYPTNIVSRTALPVYIDDVDDVEANVVNDPISELVATQAELGTLPSGSAADLTARLTVSINDDGTLKATLSPTFVDLTLSGDLAVNGSDITSTGVINLKSNNQSTDFLTVGFPDGEWAVYPSVDSSFRFGISGKVWAEGWFDSINSDGNITLNPSGNNVILDNAHLQIQGTYDLLFKGAGTITHEAESDHYLELFGALATTGWYWDHTNTRLVYKQAGSTLIQLYADAVEVTPYILAYAGLMIGSYSNDKRFDDASNGSGSTPMYIGNHIVAVSDAGTGGADSAGAGKQYVELKIGANTYKVLHDGTV